MAEVANGVYRKLIEAGIPVKLKGEYVLPSYNSTVNDLEKIKKAAKKQGINVEKGVLLDDSFSAEFKNSELKDEVNIPSLLVIANLKIGRAGIELWVNQKEFRYEGKIAKRYQGRVMKILKNEGFVDLDEGV
jgi:hypothetical protein